MRILISFHNKVIFVFATTETEIFIASKQTFWMIRHIRKFFPQVSCLSMGMIKGKNGFNQKAVEGL